MGCVTVVGKVSDGTGRYLSYFGMGHIYFGTD